MRFRGNILFQYSIATFAIILTVVQSLAFGAALRMRPEWPLCLWPGVTWDTMQMVGLWMIAVFRLAIWIALLIVVWLTIWSAKLRRMQP